VNDDDRKEKMMTSQRQTQEKKEGRKGDECPICLDVLPNEPEVVKV
jgi:hypothetical protein